MNQQFVDVPRDETERQLQLLFQYLQTQVQIVE